MLTLSGGNPDATRSVPEGTRGGTMILRWTTGLLVAVAAVGSATAGASGADLDRLQGCWVTKVGPLKGNTVTLEIRGKAVAATIKTPVGLTVEAEGEVRLDETASPKRI